MSLTLRDLAKEMVDLLAEGKDSKVYVCGLKTTGARTNESTIRPVIEIHRDAQGDILLSFRDHREEGQK